MLLAWLAYTLRVEAPGTAAHPGTHRRPGRAPPVGRAGAHRPGADGSPLPPVHPRRAGRHPGPRTQPAPGRHRQLCPQPAAPPAGGATSPTPPFTRRRKRSPTNRSGPPASSAASGPSPASATGSANGATWPNWCGKPGPCSTASRPGPRPSPWKTPCPPGNGKSWPTRCNCNRCCSTFSRTPGTPSRPPAGTSPSPSPWRRRRDAAL